jgi:ribosomal protein S18 acetylase RimI-like enzyme
MGTVAIEAYVAGTVARWAATRTANQSLIDETGVHGLLPRADDAPARLLITDDRGYETLGSALTGTHAGSISVFETAARCDALLEQRPGWTRAAESTAMVCLDLAGAPALELPDGLSLRPVRRLSTESREGVPLDDVVSLACQADPRITDPPTVFAEFLRSLPPAVRLLAAVDATGAVRATSGFGIYGAEARVFFVNTDPDWRRQGIGQAMTAAAVRAAREYGARRASLDATGTGLRIYRRVGFDAVARIAQFSASPGR